MSTKRKGAPLLRDKGHLMLGIGAQDSQHGSPCGGEILRQPPWSSMVDARGIPLDPARGAAGQHHISIEHQVLSRNRGGHIQVSHAGTARVTVHTLEVQNLILDHRPNLVFTGQQILQEGDALDNLAILFLHSPSLQRGQSPELEIENRLRLHLGEAKPLAQVGLGCVRRPRAPNRIDHLIQMVQCDQ